MPIAAAIGITATLRSLLPRPHEVFDAVALWVVLILLAGGTAIGIELGLRRLVPLTMLLRLSMLFPDRAPSRVEVAREAGSLKRLSARLTELNGDPSAEREASTAATILALATALQAHDRRTRGHAERVRVYTDLLAQELRLPAPDQYRLRWAALLHDIGKLWVSGDILNKPGTLAADEWKTIRRHPLDGERIAGPILAWLGPWAGAITDHHERYDGTGYPRGLSGRAISLAGRIVSVADAYDTMTAVRTYRRPMSVRAAREELARCAGGQFDRGGPGLLRHLASAPVVEDGAALVPR
jgi:HD-GYP domain-containing protein (c-di-GMP phosphodiesterase class II)